MTKLPTIGRSVKEWIGKTSDAMPPRLVRLRIFDRFNGICQISGAKIGPGDKWHLDHKTPLHAGGENRESNLRPVLEKAHKAKSAEEAATRAKVRRTRGKHIGIKPEPSRQIVSRGFQKPADPGKEARIRAKHIAFLERRKIG